MGFYIDLDEKQIGEKFEETKEKLGEQKRASAHRASSRKATHKMLQINNNPPTTNT